MDLYFTSQNVITSLKPMSLVRSYALVVWLNGEIYVFGGGNMDLGLRVWDLEIGDWGYGFRV